MNEIRGLVSPLPTVRIQSLVQFLKTELISYAECVIALREKRGKDNCLWLCWCCSRVYVYAGRHIQKLTCVHGIRLGFDAIAC